MSGPPPWQRCATRAPLSKEVDTHRGRLADQVVGQSAFGGFRLAFYIGAVPAACPLSGGRNAPTIELAKTFHFLRAVSKKSLWSVNFLDLVNARFADEW
jgi:hypothetical protein